MFKQQIIIVKPADSQSEDYDKALTKFAQKEFCAGGVDALQFLETSPAHVAIVETTTEDMSGIEIAESIRDIDEDINHFTYIILIGDEDPETLIQGAVSTVDIHLPNAAAGLLQAVTAGQRIAAQTNQLKQQVSQLSQINFELQKGQLLDPLTGLGNRRMAEHSLDDSIRQIESRGGAVCVLMIAIDNYAETLEKYDQKIADDLVVSIADKIRHLVRPLDIVCYFDTGQFALILIQPSIEHCTAECYQRIYDGVRLKSYNTAAGFLPANIAMAICASHAENGPPNPTAMIEKAQQCLLDAATLDQIIVHHLSPVE